MSDLLVTVAIGGIIYEREKMYEFLIILAAVAVWLVLPLWVLPRLGVPT